MPPAALAEATMLSITAGRAVWADAVPAVEKTRSTAAMAVILFCMVASFCLSLFIVDHPFVS
jgi:hypothetical protein